MTNTPPPSPPKTNPHGNDELSNVPESTPPQASTNPPGDPNINQPPNQSFDQIFGDLIPAAQTPPPSHFPMTPTTDYEVPTTPNIDNTSTSQKPSSGLGSTFQPHLVPFQAPNPGRAPLPFPPRVPVPAPALLPLPQMRMPPPTLGNQGGQRPVIMGAPSGGPTNNMAPITPQLHQLAITLARQIASQQQSLLDVRLKSIEEKLSNNASFSSPTTSQLQPLQQSTSSQKPQEKKEGKKRKRGKSGKADNDQGQNDQQQPTITPIISAIPTTAIPPSSGLPSQASLLNPAQAFSGVNSTSTSATATPSPITASTPPLSQHAYPPASLSTGFPTGSSSVPNSASSPYPMPSYGTAPPYSYPVFPYGMPFPYMMPPYPFFPYYGMPPVSPSFVGGTPSPAPYPSPFPPYPSYGFAPNFGQPAPVRASIAPEEEQEEEEQAEPDAPISSSAQQTTKPSKSKEKNELSLDAARKQLLTKFFEKLSTDNAVVPGTYICLITGKTGQSYSKRRILVLMETQDASGKKSFSPQWFVKLKDGSTLDQINDLSRIESYNSIDSTKFASGYWVYRRGPKNSPGLSLLELFALLNGKDKNNREGIKVENGRLYFDPSVLNSLMNKALTNRSEDFSGYSLWGYEPAESFFTIQKRSDNQVVFIHKKPEQLNFLTNPSLADTTFSTLTSTSSSNQSSTTHDEREEESDDDDLEEALRFSKQPRTTEAVSNQSNVNLSTSSNAEKGNADKGTTTKSGRARKQPNFFASEQQQPTTKKSRKDKKEPEPTNTQPGPSQPRSPSPGPQGSLV